MAPDQQLLALNPVESKQQRHAWGSAKANGIAHARSQGMPSMRRDHPWARTAMPEREVSDKTLLVDQMGTKQQSESIRVRLFAQQTFRER